MKDIIVEIELIPEPIVRTVQIEIPDEADVQLVVDALRRQQFADEVTGDWLDVESANLIDEEEAFDIDQQFSWQDFEDEYGLPGGYYEYQASQKAVYLADLLEGETTP